MDLLNFLQTNPFSRKIFGKRELKIIEKQLNGISLTQSEKNRLSRDIRAKFKFIQECSRFQEEFSLKKGSVNKELISSAKQVILADCLASQIEKIVLFGSAINNQLTSRSDLDLAVFFKKISSTEATLFRSRISGRIDDKVDVQVFNVLPRKIKKEILIKNRVIYENKR